MTEDEYLEAEDGLMGWCTGCKELTRPNTETDAEGYNCPDCHLPHVLGVSLALIAGEIVIH